MLKLNFLNKWGKINSLEKKAIETLKKSSKLLLKSIPSEEIVSMYVWGSFVRRELNKDSDVDLCVILKTKKYMSVLKKFAKIYEHKFVIDQGFSGYTLWELRTGKRIKNKLSGTPPNRFMKHIEDFILIYGKDISKMKCFMPDDKRYLMHRINFVRDRVLPLYHNKSINFQELIKQVFWLIESEQYVLGEDVPHGFKELTKSINDKNHVVHDTLNLRLHSCKDKKTISIYLRKLNRYLVKLEKLL